MPEVSRFYGIVITMYWGDHSPPHFHARYGLHKAKFFIDPAALGGAPAVHPHRGPEMTLVDDTNLDRAEQTGEACGEVARVTGVRHLGGYVLELTFADGTSGPLDMEWVLDPFDGVFGPLRDPDTFSRVRVDPDAETIVWPNGADVCPDVLYGDVTDRPIPSATPEWNEERARNRRAARERATRRASA